MARKVVGFAGQSNGVAQGMGAFSEAAPKSNDSRIFQIGRAPYHTDMAVVPAAEPLDNVFPGIQNGHGWGMEMLRWLAAYPGFLGPDDDILAVPGCRGGTDILYWNGVEPYTDPVTNQQFDLNADFIARMDVAVTYGPCQLIVWDQSEADIARVIAQTDRHMKTGADYVAQFQTLIGGWRTRYGTMPIIWVPPAPIWMAGVQGKLDVLAAMQALVGVLPKFSIVDNTGFRSNSCVTGDTRDDIHYCAEWMEYVARAIVYPAYGAAL